MAQSGIEVVRQLFERFAEHGVEGGLELLDEEIVIEIPPELSAEPDDYRGHNGVRRYFAGFAGMLDDVRFEPLELIPAGDHAIAHLRFSGRGVSSGLPAELEAFVLNELRDGKIVRMRPYPDLESAEAALG